MALHSGLLDFTLIDAGCGFVATKP